MKRFIALLLTMVMVFSLAACSKGDKGSKAPVNKDQLNVCLASEPDTIDPALNSAVDGATMLCHLFSGLAKWAQDDSGKLVIVADAAKELTEGVENADGTVTYTYELKDGLKWSDGKAVTAQDFVFAWNRAASVELASDYGYLFEIVDGFADMWEMDKDDKPVNPDAKLNVKAEGDNKIIVTLVNKVNYWNELLAFPVFFPVREDVVSNEAWATNPKTYISNGAYKMTGWDHNSVIKLEKNDDYYDAKNVTIKSLNFYLSDDNNNMLTNFKNGDWQLIDEVPTNDIPTLKKDFKDEFNVEGQLGTYYVCWNINKNLLPSDSKLTGAEAEKAMAEIRSAMGLLLDRNYIVNEISQGGQVPASSFVAMGLTDADGKTQFYQNAGSDKKVTGYYDVTDKSVEKNYNAAIETLKKYYKFDEKTGKFTNVPTLSYIYNTDDNHKAIAEYIQGALAGVGITVNLDNQEWNTFLNTRKDGGYTVARNGWIGDYNDPISFLDLWTSGSGNNDVQFGKGAHKTLKAYSLDLTGLGYQTKVVNGTWAETYDVLIAAIKTCTDTETRYKLMHMAEDMLMESGCIMPLYFYTDIYMLNSNVKGFYSNPLGYKYFMYCTIGD